MPPFTILSMALRAFPVLYAKDVERVAGFWGERVAFASEGNIITLATAADRTR